jgi:hypothetical protein
VTLPLGLSSPHEFANTLRAEIAVAPAVRVHWVRQDFEKDQRFHLWFAYPHTGDSLTESGLSWGDEVVMAESIEQAAVRIMQSREVRSLYVRKRYFSGKPTSEAEPIQRIFIMEESA